MSFTKDGSVGLRLVGGNDVGIFVGGVQPNSPAYAQGMKEGDQIMQVNKKTGLNAVHGGLVRNCRDTDVCRLSLQVNNVDFGQLTREEAANFLLNIKRGEQVKISTQHKRDSKLVTKGLR